jgi:hypothetical protein
MKCTRCGKDHTEADLHACGACGGNFCNDCLAEFARQRGYGWGDGPALFYDTASKHWICAECFPA